ncbi:hypothetical protein BC832DRAFT_609404 [Gaertneriomyces semiglobifer]|nr:hypothetical protein BC832DRAFT_609404 [Gaertneriomyces semiglobifer]
MEWKPIVIREPPVLKTTGRPPGTSLRGSSTPPAPDTKIEHPLPRRALTPPYPKGARPVETVFLSISEVDVKGKGRAEGWGEIVMDSGAAMGGWDSGMMEIAPAAEGEGEPYGMETPERKDVVPPHTFYDINQNVGMGREVHELVSTPPHPTSVHRISREQYDSELTGRLPHRPGMMSVPDAGVSMYDELHREAPGHHEELQHPVYRQAVESDTQREMGARPLSEREWRDRQGVKSDTQQREPAARPLGEHEWKNRQTVKFATHHEPGTRSLTEHEWRREVQGEELPPSGIVWKRGLSGAGRQAAEKQYWMLKEGVVGMGSVEVTSSVMETRVKGMCGEKMTGEQVKEGIRRDVRRRRDEGGSGGVETGTSGVREEARMEPRSGAGSERERYPQATNLRERNYEEQNPSDTHHRNRYETRPSGLNPSISDILTKEQRYDSHTGGGATHARSEEPLGSDPTTFPSQPLRATSFEGAPRPAYRTPSFEGGRKVNIDYDDQTDVSTARPQDLHQRARSLGVFPVQSQSPTQGRAEEPHPVKEGRGMQNVGGGSAQPVRIDSGARGVGLWDREPAVERDVWGTDRGARKEEDVRDYFTPVLEREPNVRLSPPVYETRVHHTTKPVMNREVGVNQYQRLKAQTTPSYPQTSSAGMGITEQPSVSRDSQVGGDDRRHYEPGRGIQYDHAGHQEPRHVTYTEHGPRGGVENAKSAGVGGGDMMEGQNGGERKEMRDQVGGGQNGGERKEMRDQVGGDQQQQQQQPNQQDQSRGVMGSAMNTLSAAAGRMGSLTGYHPFTSESGGGEGQRQQGKGKEVVSRSQEVGGQTVSGVSRAFGGGRQEEQQAEREGERQPKRTGSEHIDVCVRTVPGTAEEVEEPVRVDDRPVAGEQEMPRGGGVTETKPKETQNHDETETTSKPQAQSQSEAKQDVPLSQEHDQTQTQQQSGGLVHRTVEAAIQIEHKAAQAVKGAYEKAVTAAHQAEDVAEGAVGVGVGAAKAVGHRAGDLVWGRSGVSEHVGEARLREAGEQHASAGEEHGVHETQAVSNRGEEQPESTAPVCETQPVSSKGAEQPESAESGSQGEVSHAASDQPSDNANKDQEKSNTELQQPHGVSHTWASTLGNLSGAAMGGLQHLMSSTARTAKQGENAGVRSDSKREEREESEQSGESGASGMTGESGMTGVSGSGVTGVSGSGGSNHDVTLVTEFKDLHTSTVTTSTGSGSTKPLVQTILNDDGSVKQVVISGREVHVREE